MKLGMTGNRFGMSDVAKKRLIEFIESNNITEVHHGDCVGADKDFHDICESFNIKIIIHPPIIDDLRAFCKSDVILEPKDYHVRNNYIVDSTDMLIGFPNSKKETLRSGTWSTIRHARRTGKDLHIIFPNGDVSNK
jgi:hypothetical protein